MSVLYSWFRKPKIALWGVFIGRSIFIFIVFFNLYKSKLALMHPWKRCIGVSFLDWQREQSGHESFLNLKSLSFKYNKIFKILYWKIHRFVSTVTRRGKRHRFSQSMSLFCKRSSKYNCAIVFEIVRDIYRQSNSFLLYLSKKKFIWFLLTMWCSYTDRVSEMQLFLRSFSFQDLGIVSINRTQK